MRPIQLSLTGLHSFRKEQVIDFDSLCNGGVFGIFGPTGSGKSSLLDAMTLALYGKVERAANNTKGIMNHAENKLSVAYTFELGQTSPRRFRVERGYKRTKTGGMQITTCRLLKLDETNDVIADKERDVTLEIKKLLGLTHEDFTRAVVLPQGKFAEFLTLKGAERRRMLQRLFQLEKYGDRLNQTIREHLQKQESELTAIQAEKQGLGNASKEHLDELSEQWLKVQEQFKQSEIKHQDVEQKYQSVKQKREKTKELEEMERQQQLLAENRDSVNEWRSALERATQADQVLPYLQEKQASETQIIEANQAFDQAKTEHDLAIERESKAYQSFEQAKQTRESEQPVWQEKIQQLKQAVTLNESVIELQKQQATAEQELEQIKTKLKAFEEQEKEINSQEDSSKRQLKTLEKQVSATSISPELREKVTSGLQEKQKILSEKAHYKTLKKEWQDSEAQLKSVSAENKQADDLALLQQEKLENYYAKVLSLYYQATTYEHQLATSKEWLRQNQMELEQRFNQLKEAHLAQGLAHGLKAEQPCPVCGSKHHPKPADTDDVSQEQAREVKASIQKTKECQTTVDEALPTAQQIKTQLEGVSQQFIQQGLKGPNEANTKENYLKEPDRWDHENVKSFVIRLFKEIKAVKQDFLHLQQQIYECFTDNQKATQDVSTSKTKKKAAQEHFERVNQRLEMFKDEIRQKKKNWDERFTDLTYETIEQEYKQIMNADADREKIEQTISKKRNELEEISDKKRDLFEKRQKSQEHYYQWQSKFDENTNQLRQKHEEVKTLIGKNESTPTDALKEAESYVKTIVSAEKYSYDAWKQANQIKSEAERVYERATTTLNKTKERFATATSTLESIYHKHGFETDCDVETALMEENKKVKFQESIQAHDRQDHYVNEEISRLVKLLSDGRITEHHLKQVEEVLVSTKNRYNELMRQEAALGNEVHDLKEKHGRYQELSTQQRKTENIVRRLNELKNVFRGNSFVEFIAEEQLTHICQDASNRLGQLTHQRYGLEVDTEGGFIIRDDANGGIKRPVSSLSGGETFLTSLALALSLSTQIQLRGEVPLQFFFLDEGFGTLDHGLLETVITALERLQMNNMAIGVISHVPELQERLPKKLLVHPAEPSGEGSRVEMERIGMV